MFRADDDALGEHDGKKASHADHRYDDLLADAAHDAQQALAAVEDLGPDAVAVPRAVEDRGGDHVERDVRDRQLGAAEERRALARGRGAVAARVSLGDAARQEPLRDGRAGPLSLLAQHV